MDSYMLNMRTGDGKCVICDSYVRPAVLSHVCDECNYGSYEGRWA
jgi:PHD finger-like domain-containing protein 5A